MRTIEDLDGSPARRQDDHAPVRCGPRLLDSEAQAVTIQAYGRIKVIDR